MDAIRNPFAPGAGSRPPELAGRDHLLETVRVAIGRVAVGRSAKSVLLTGLHGVGKTVLLDAMRDQATGVGVHTVRIEAPEGRSLPSLLAPELRRALLGLSRIERGKDKAERALRALAGFVRALKMQYGDISASMGGPEEPGIADNGDLEQDLQVLMEVVGEAAASAGTALAIFIDEMQYVATEELAALITAMHRISQRGLPVVLVGAGLPQLPGRFGDAKSYAERLFDFPVVGALDEEAARAAIVKPLKDEGVGIEDEALAAILETTERYPYFLQEWGARAWEVAKDSPITREDVRFASEIAVTALDESFFRVRFDRLTPAEKRYLRAMAEIGPGPHRSGEIAEVLGVQVSSAAPTRSKLISKGMIWSPGHGDTAFTVPLFDQFMRRAMPDLD